MNGIFVKPMTKKRDVIVNQWPDYTPPPREITYHSSFNTNSSAETPLFGSGSSFGKGRSTPSLGSSGSSFAYAQKTPSIGSSSSGFGYTQKTPSVGSTASRFGYAQNTPSATSLISGSGYVQNMPSSGSMTPTGSFASSSRATLSSRMTPNAGSSMVDDAGVPINSDGNRIGLGISLGLPEATSFAEEIETEIARRDTCLPHSGSLPDRSPSPNIMNALNEQDPAFTRGLEGLRLASENGDAGEASSPSNKKKQGNKKGKKKGKKH